MSDMGRIYGVEQADYLPVQQHLENTLNIRFELHDSLYLGPYSLYKGPNDERIMLRENIDPVDGDFAEKEFPTMLLLLLVDGYGKDSVSLRDLEASFKSCVPEIRFLRQT